MIQVIKLKDGTLLITQLEVVQQVEYGAPNTRLINPFELNNKERWLSEYTDQNIFMIDDADILTMAEPNETLLERYKKANKIQDKIEYDEVIDEEEEEHY